MGGVKQKKGKKKSTCAKVISKQDEIKIIEKMCTFYGITPIIVTRDTKITEKTTTSLAKLQIISQKYGKTHVFLEIVQSVDDFASALIKAMLAWETLRKTLKNDPEKIQSIILTQSAPEHILKLCQAIHNAADEFVECMMNDNSNNNEHFLAITYNGNFSYSMRKAYVQTLEEILRGNGKQVCCPICLENVGVATTKWKCGHRVCESCIQEMMKTEHNTCPLCRSMTLKNEIEAIQYSSQSIALLQKLDSLERQLLKAI